MELYIVKHGETIWNKEKRLQGSTDIELGPEGIRLAKETGEALMDTHIDVIYSIFILFYLFSNNHTVILSPASLC